MVVVILALQCASLLLASHLWSTKGGELTPESVLAVAIAFLLVAPLGLAGIVWAIVGVMKGWARPLVAAIVLAVSLVMAVPILSFYPIRWIGGILRPFTARVQAHDAQLASVKYRNELATHYDDLLIRFREPRRVVKVVGSEFLLDDRSVVDLVGLPRRGNWSVSDVVGREVQVVLPDRATFEAHYILGLKEAFKEARPLDPVTRSEYGDVPAFLLCEGRLLILRIASDPAAEEKYFRDHANLGLTPAPRAP